MTALSHAPATPPVATDHHAASTALRSAVIALIAFLTVVDLFATQAILPSLANAYGVPPAAIGFAVNASTISMAAVARS
jgi:YNFM family putative membrane transporter